MSAEPLTVQIGAWAIGILGFGTLFAFVAAALWHLVPGRVKPLLARAFMPPMRGCLSVVNNAFSAGFLVLMYGFLFFLRDGLAVGVGCLIATLLHLRPTLWILPIGICLLGWEMFRNFEERQIAIQRQHSEIISELRRRPL